MYAEHSRGNGHMKIPNWTFNLRHEIHGSNFVEIKENMCTSIKYEI